MTLPCSLLLQFTQSDDEAVDVERCYLAVTLTNDGIYTNMDALFSVYV